MYCKIKALLSFPLPRILTEKFDSMYILGMAIGISLKANMEQPFELIIWHYQFKSMILWGYGVIFGFVYFFLKLYFEAVFNKLFNTGDWTAGKEMLNSIVFFYITGLTSWLFSLALIPSIKASWSTFFSFQLYTLELYFIPFFLLYCIVLMRFYYKQWKCTESLFSMHLESNAVMPREELIKLFGKTFIRAEIIFFHVIANTVYIHVFHKGENNKFDFTSSLRQTETLLTGYPEFMKCQVAYIVNKNKLQSYTGNSLNMEMKLENCPDMIPVAREKVKIFKEIIENNKSLL